MNTQAGTQAQAGTAAGSGAASRPAAASTGVGVRGLERGRTVAELRVGEVASFSKTIAECDVYGFAGITGDLVRRDAEGFYYVVDRKKDMYKSGGENVYPVEVETFLRTHPGIREVSVVGVPDPKWGEVGLAWVAPAPGTTLTAEDVVAFCQGQLARYKIPKHVRFLPELPRGDSGKVLKRELKARAAAELAAQQEVHA